MNAEATAGVHPAYELDWNLIRTFVAVAGAGSLAAGARCISITHPTAARHVQQLEAAMNVQLFSRTAQGLTLNEAGDRLYAEAQEMHRSALSVQACSDGLRRGLGGRVAVTVGEMMASVMPQILSDLRAELPMSIDLKVTNQSLNLLEREADIAMRHSRPVQQELLCRQLGDLTMGAFASPEYVAEYGEVSPMNLADHAFIDGLSRDFLLRGASRAGMHIESDQIVFRSDSVASQLAAAQSGWGVAVVPHAVARAGNTEGLVAVWQGNGPDEQLPSLPLWLVARPEVRSNDELRAVYTALGDAAKEALNCGHTPKGV